MTKRLRGEELGSFLEGPGRDGSYLRLTLKGPKSFKTKGWPWIQAGIRKVLGQEKVEKATLLRDGSVLMKTKNKLQTDKLLKLTTFMGEECVVDRDEKLNVSRGTIHSYDMMDLSDEEVVHWLSCFGVTHAKRFTRKVGSSVENTPTLLLTFNTPSCPTKLQLDYVTYHVKQYVPNPLICFKCGQFGHPEARCKGEHKCLKCGELKHTGDCMEKCISCAQLGHSCLSRQCAVWQKERDICALKVEHEIPYGQAKRMYENTHRPPVLQGYAEVVRTPSASHQQDSELKEKVEKLEGKVERLEQKIDGLTAILTQIAKQQKGDGPSTTDGSQQVTNMTEKVGEVEQGGGAMEIEKHAVSSHGTGASAPTDKAAKDVNPKAKMGGGGKEKNPLRKTVDKTADTNVVEMDDVSGSSQVLGRGRPLERGQRQRGSSRGSSTRRSWTDTL